MNRTLVLLFGFPAMLIAELAFAADRLHPTDVLQAGETDGSLGFSATQLKIPYRDFPVELNVEQVAESLSVRTGLLEGFHVEASVPYYSKYEASFDYSTGSALAHDDDGWGNIELGASYRVLGRSPGDAALVASVARETNSGTRGASWTGAMKVGASAQNAWRPYALYSFTVQDDEARSDAHQVTFGVFTRTDGGAIFEPYLHWSGLESSAAASSQDIYLVGLDMYLPVGTMTHLNPHVDYLRYGDVEFENGAAFKEGDGWSVGVALYRLFGK